MHFDPFRTLSPDERAEQLAAHRALMRERDGDLDLARPALPRREQFLRDIEADPVAWRAGLAREDFRAGLARAPGPDLDARVLWLRAAAKANEGETYGVELELTRFARKGYAGVDRHLLYVAMEDRDHTRMLSHVCGVFGLSLDLRPPKLPTRILVRAMNYMPEKLRFLAILCGEVVGAVFFRILHDRCDLFRAQPEVEERLRLVTGEILTDEIGHVAFCRARLAPNLLPVARVVAPRVGAALLREIPEIALLGGGRRAVLAHLRRDLEAPAAFGWLEPSLLASA